MNVPKLLDTDPAITRLADSVVPEPLTFKLARSCRYTPDFIVQLPDGTIEAHEVKIHTGSKLLAEDDAKAKIRVAAEKFGMLVWRIAAKQPKKLGGGWLYFLVGEEF